MIKFLRKYNRKLLAFSSVFLMISFLATTRYNPGAGPRTGVTIGKINDTVPVLDTELDHARQSWKLLSTSIVQQVPDPTGGSQSRYLPVYDSRNPIIAALEADPKFLCLLVKEARQMGVVVSDQEIQQSLSQQPIRLPDGRVVPFEQITDEDLRSGLIDAQGQVRAIQQAVDRAARINKISKPLVMLAVSQAHQSVQVRYVSFDVTKFIDKVPAPTTQQLQAHFDQFADVEPTATTSETNPFGLGYKIADQCRLQTISIPRSELKTAVRKTKGDYEWDVAAHMYYRSHKELYQSETKNTPPADASVTLASTKPAGPTTKPFDEVKDKVMDAVMAPEVAALSETVQKEIQSTLDSDWREYHKEHATSQAASQATSAGPSVSSLGASFDSYDYFKALAAKVQKDWNVLPATANYSQPMTSVELGKLPGIGEARGTNGGLDFEAAASQRSTDLFEPSTPLTAEDDSVYLFRLTDRIASHRPASVNDVLAAVTTDWKKLQAYDLAKKSADALLTASKTSGLGAAAASAGVSIATTGWFGGSSQATGDAPPSTIRTNAGKLLTLAAGHEPAVALMEAPTQSKVFVAELAGIRPDWQDGHQYSAEGQAALETFREFAQPMEQAWFSLPAVEARLNYKDSSKPLPG